jgi:hypothetical protein
MKVREKKTTRRLTQLPLPVMCLPAPQVKNFYAIICHLCVHVRTIHNEISNIMFLEGGDKWLTDSLRGARNNLTTLLSLSGTEAPHRGSDEQALLDIPEHSLGSFATTHSIAQMTANLSANMTQGVGNHASPPATSL